MAALTALTTALTIGGTVLSAVGQISAARAQADAADYNARVAERDAFVADQNRKASIRQAEVDAEDKRRENRRVLASMRTSYGASGVDLAGSPLDVLYDTALEQETDTRRVEYEGRVRGREGALQMLGLEEDSTLSRMEARSSRTAGTIAAFGSLASGAGRTLSRMG